MSGNQCPDHPDGPVISGLCAACTYWPQPGRGCRSTVHCASFGFCHRCSPELARSASFALQALKEVGREWDGELYGQVMETIRAGMGDMSESFRGS